MSLDAEQTLERFRLTEKVNPTFQFPAALDPHKDVLVIIDMQTYFSSARKPETIAACQDLLRRFMAAKCYILLVEYVRRDKAWAEKHGEEMGCTHCELNALLDDYNKIVIVQKNQDNGSKNVYEAINAFLCKDPLQMRLTICGVNIMACVAQTVRGLLAKGFSDLIMAKQACNCSCDSWRNVWADFYRQVKDGCIWDRDGLDKKLNVINGPAFDLLNAVA